MIPFGRGTLPVTIKSSLWSSISFSSVSIASWPKSACPPVASVYASSINSTPPRAVFTTSVTLSAVCPI